MFAARMKHMIRCVELMKRFNVNSAYYGLKSNQIKLKRNLFFDATINLNRFSRLIIIPGITSSTSDSEITNGDSGFQEMNNAEDNSPDQAISTHDDVDVDVDSDLKRSERCIDLGDEDDCDVLDGASDVSELSCMSCISDFSGQDWKPVSGPIAWVHHQMCNGTDPRDILNELIPDTTLLPPDLDNITLWRIIFNMLSEPPRRRKLPNVNTLNDVVELIKKSNKIMVLTGAGVRKICVFKHLNNYF